MSNEFDELVDLISDREELNSVILKMKEALIEAKLVSLGLRIGDLVTSHGHDGFLCEVYIYQASYTPVTPIYEYRCLHVKKDGMPSKNYNYKFTSYPIDTLCLANGETTL